MTAAQTRIEDAVRVRTIAAWWYATARLDADAACGDADRFSAEQAIACRRLQEGQTSWLPSIQDAWTAHVAAELEATLEGAS